MPLPNVSRSFREGRFFDLWMLVHVVAGFAGASTNVFWGLGVTRVYVIAFVLMVAWEIAEWLVGVRESWENRVLDIVVGLVGASVTLLTLARFSRRVQLVGFVAAMLLLAGLSTAGWVAFRRRRVGNREP